MKIQNILPDIFSKVFLPTIPGWCTEEKAEALAKYVTTHQPQLVVEIGVFGGRSLLAIAVTLERNKYGRVIGIDSWDQNTSASGFSGADKEWWLKLDHVPIKATCESAIKRHKLEAYIELIHATSRDALKAITALNAPIDLLHIDGNISQEQSLLDVQEYIPLVAKGGYVFYGECNRDTVQDAMALMMAYCDFLDIVSNCAIFKKK